MRHPYETDREFSTGELDADLPEPESDSERDLRVSGTFAESQARLSRALDALTAAAVEKRME